MLSSAIWAASGVRGISAGADVVQRLRRVPLAHPRLVDQAPPRGGEQPGPPGRLVPDEPRQPADHVDPGLRGDVLGVLRGENAQVAKESGIRITPQDRELVFAAALGVRKHPREVVAHHMLSIGT